MVKNMLWFLSTRERDPVPMVQEAGWAPGPVWTGVEYLALTGIYIIHKELLVVYVAETRASNSVRDPVFAGAVERRCQ